MDWQFLSISSCCVMWPDTGFSWDNHRLIIMDYGEGLQALLTTLSGLHPICTHCGAFSRIMYILDDANEFLAFATKIHHSPSGQRERRSVELRCVDLLSDQCWQIRVNVPCR